MIKMDNIRSPKNKSAKKTGRALWYNYYAGYSKDFATELISEACLNPQSIILDPWNGSGTTTSVSAELGYSSIGFDLNPVMVFIAKARLVSKREKNSLMPLAWEIIDNDHFEYVEKDDPLLLWFTRKSVKHIRGIERNIQKLLIDEKEYIPFAKRGDYSEVSDLASFFYMALFRLVNFLLQPFRSKNPTWIKKPSNLDERLELRNNIVKEQYLYNVKFMVDSLIQDPCDISNSDVLVNVDVSPSTKIPLKTESVDFILTSPPYCTRIDYARSTQPELSILGYNIEDKSDTLRSDLIGTTTVSKVVNESREAWGPTCNQFMSRLKQHSSKASKTYYFKNHMQYFDGIYRSILELTRVLKKNGSCFIVVQDSHYKEIHNNLQRVIIEMSEGCGCDLMGRVDFNVGNSYVKINSDSNKYLSKRHNIESVLHFVRNVK